MGGDVRKIVFWAHLSLGVAAGLPILVMAATGVLLVFEGPLVSLAEADNPRPAASDAPRLSLEALAAKAREAAPEAKLSAVTVRSGATPVVFNFGREKSLALDPRTGEVLRSGSRTRAAFKKIEGIHRWLGSRDLGQPVTAAANAAFLLLVLGGPILWWPRSRKSAIVSPNFALKGKSRDFNWHNAFGIWAAPVLLTITASGVLMSYDGATAFLYKTLGEGAPVAAPLKPAGPGPIGLDAAFTAGATLIPGWDSVALRLPGKPGEPLNVSITEPADFPPVPRSQLRLDAATGETLKWEPASAAGRGRRWRALARFLHTGEALGVPGRVAAGLASAAAVLLVWTGLALAWRRWRTR